MIDVLGIIKSNKHYFMRISGILMYDEGNEI